MVERTASLYVVGRWGVGDTAVGGAEGGIVGAEVSSSSSARLHVTVCVTVTIGSKIME
jgi:hypothetical protein